MAEIPTTVANVDPVTRVQQPSAYAPRAGADMTILGEGLERGAEGFSRAAEHMYHSEQRLKELTIHHQEVIERLMKEKDAQVNTLAVNSRYNQMRTDWNNRLIQYQQNPQPDLLNTATKEFDDYTKELINGAPTDIAKKELGLHAAAYRIEFRNEAFRLQSMQQLQMFGATFDKMMSNADDSIYATKSAQEMQVQKDILSNTIDGAVSTKQIVDPTTIQNLRDKVNLLGVSWAEANMATNPEMVKEGIKSGLLEGVSAQHKYVLENKADETIKTKGNQERILLNQALQSDIVQRLETGEGNSLNLDRYGEVEGPEAKAIAMRKLSNASSLYQTIELSKGASQEQLQGLLEKAKPTALSNSPEFGEQQAYYDDVFKVVHQAMSDKENNTFDYFAANPAAKALDYRKLGMETEQNNLRKPLQDAVLELQQADKSIMPYQYQIMPKIEAEQFIENFNKLTEVGSKTDGAGVMDALREFNEKYKDHFQMAINQLNNTKGGDRITGKLNPLLWHINNPSTFRQIVDAIRKDPQEAYARFKTEKELKNFQSDAKLDPNVTAFQNSVLASNNSAEAQHLASGTYEAWRDFARDYTLNGGKIKDASAAFFSTHSYTMMNGTAYARPTIYADEMGDNHRMSDEQKRLSDNYLDFFPQSLDPSKIHPASIVNDPSFTDEQLHKDVKNALRANTFWATDESETGVYLFTKGSMVSAPRQVMYKDGSPVHQRFIDTIKSIPQVPFGEKPGRVTPYTGDTWMDKWANSILTGG